MFVLLYLNVTPAMPILSDAVAFIVIVPLTTDLFCGEVILTVGGIMSKIVLLIFTNIVVVAVFDELSIAIAVMVCCELVYNDVSHPMAYGAIVTWPIFVPSIKNCTSARATSSEALATMMIWEDTLVLFRGFVMEIVGLVVSGDG